MSATERAERDARMRALLIERLKVSGEGDRLLECIHWLIEANRDSEMESLAIPIMGDEAAHRSRGRLSAFLDLADQLEKAKEEAQRLEVTSTK